MLCPKASEATAGIAADTHVSAPACHVRGGTGGVGAGAVFLIWAKTFLVRKAGGYHEVSFRRSLGKLRRSSTVRLLEQMAALELEKGAAIRSRHSTMGVFASADSMEEKPT